MDINLAIQEAMQKANGGDVQSAQLILASIIRQEPRNARAWYLLSQVIGDRNREIDCLKKVLEIEPNSQQAKDRLQTLQPVEPNKPNPVIPSIRPVYRNKKPSGLWIFLILGFTVLGVFCLVLYLSIQNAPDATQCVQLKSDFCLMAHRAGNTSLEGFIINSCDKPITNINLDGNLFSGFDNSKLTEVSALQKIVLAPGQEYFFQLIDPNSYYGDYTYCTVKPTSAYFVK